MYNLSDEFIRIVRIMISDPTKAVYTDEQIVDLILVAARQVIEEVSFINTYTISLMQRSISPSPFDISPADESFINLVSLKAACILDVGTLRTEALKSGVRIVQDKSQIETSNRFSSFKDLITIGWCKLYEQAKREYILDRASIAGEAIMTPLRTIDGFPSGVE